MRGTAAPALVLVADCDPEVTRAARAELTAALDCYVLTANSVDAAARWLRLVRPAAAVVCHVLDGGGVDALAPSLTTEPPARTDAVPLVLLTTAPNGGPPSGFAGPRVPKPLAPGALPAAVRAVLAR